MYNLTTTDLTSVGGPQVGWVLDTLAVEVNLTTNEPLFIWSPLAHVPVNESHVPLGSFGSNSSMPYDWFHINSIQSHDGKYLINSRNTWTSYYVNQTGDIEWRIDGKDGGDFGSLPDSVQFVSSHSMVPSYNFRTSVSFGRLSSRLTCRLVMAAPRTHSRLRTKQSAIY